MATFPIFQLPLGANKIRFKEPFVSEGLNAKVSGIVPKGIYNGYTPVAIGANKLRLALDPVRGDSVGVVDTLQHFNLTVRHTSAIDLDFTAHVVFPVFVVIRTQYQITASPFSGLTDSKIMTVAPASVLPDDVKLCKVTGILAGAVIFSIVPPDRDDNGGTLVTQTQLNESNVSKSIHIGAVAPAVLPAGGFVVVPGMSTVPQAGRYIVFFTATIDGATVVTTRQFAIFVNGVVAPDSVRRYEGSADLVHEDRRYNFCCVTSVVLDGVTTVDGRVSPGGAGLIVLERGLTFVYTGVP